MVKHTTFSIYLHPQPLSGTWKHDGRPNEMTNYAVRTTGPPRTRTEKPWESNLWAKLHKESNAALVRGAEGLGRRSGSN